MDSTVGDVMSNPSAVFGRITDVYDVADMEVTEGGSMVAADRNSSVLRNGKGLSLSGGVLPWDVDAAQFGLGGGSKSNGEDDDSQNGLGTKKSCFHNTNMLNSLPDA